jgi:hypothetical protein
MWVSDDDAFVGPKDERCGVGGRFSLGGLKNALVHADRNSQFFGRTIEIQSHKQPLVPMATLISKDVVLRG